MIHSSAKLEFGIRIYEKTGFVNKVVLQNVIKYIWHILLRVQQ